METLVLQCIVGSKKSGITATVNIHFKKKELSRTINNLGGKILARIITRLESSSLIKGIAEHEGKERRFRYYANYKHLSSSSDNFNCRITRKHRNQDVLFLLTLG